MRLICSRRLKYNVDGLEEMAFCSKLSQVTEAILADVASSECNHLMRANALQALRDLCDGSLTLPIMLKEAVNKISIAVMPMKIEVACAIPLGESVHFVHPLNASLQKADPCQDSLALRSVLTGQPLISLCETGRRAVETSLGVLCSCPLHSCFPLAHCAQVARGVLLLNTSKRDGASVTADTINFLETAAMLLGTAIDRRCKAHEIAMLSDLHQDVCQCHISTREIYRSCLSSLRRQLFSGCRVSIWQLLSISPDLEADKRCCGGKLSLFLNIIDVHGLSPPCLSNLTATICNDRVEIGRICSVKPKDSGCEFETRILELPLEENWLSSILQVELFQSTGGTLVKSVGLVRLRGSYYLHLPTYATSYQLTNSNIEALPGELSMDLRLRPSTVAIISPRKPVESFGNSPPILLAQVSIIKGIHVPSRYACVFRNKQGAELGRTPISGYTSFPAWKQLNISLMFATDESCDSMSIELVSMSAVNSLITIASAELAYDLLLHLPRSNAEVSAQLVPFNSLETAEEGSTEGVEVLLRMEQRCRQLSRSRDTPAPVLCLTNVVSCTRLTNGAVEFSHAPVEAAGDVLNSVRDACHNRAPCHIAGGAESFDLLVVPFSDVSVKIGRRSVRPIGGTNFAVVVAAAPGYMLQESLWFINDVTKITEANLRYSRQQELRDTLRAHTSAQISANCVNWAITSLPEIIDDALHLACKCLPGCCMYLSLLKPGGEELLFVASNAQSHMCGESTLRGQGISFGCVGPMHGRSIIVSMQTGETRIYRNTPSLLPYVCVPLIHNKSVLGVLGVDTFGYVSKADKSLGTPEDGVLHFLESVGSSIGRAIDLRRKTDALAKLNAQKISLEEIYRISLCSINRNILFVAACELWEMDSEREMHIVARLTPSGDFHSCSASVKKREDSTRMARTYDTNGTVVVDQLVMGKILDLALHSNFLKVNLIGEHPRRLIVPLVGLEVPRMLVIALQENFQPCNATVSYVMAVARAVQSRC